MKNTQFHFFLIFLIAGFGVLGYTSYRTIDFNFAPTATVDASGLPVTSDPDQMAVPPATNQVPLATLDSAVTDPTVSTPAIVAEPATTAPAIVETKELTGERKTLANSLENLIKDDIRMKIGSSGTRVGTVQKFMNIYENKKTTVDNKYGEGLKKSMTEFQKATGDEVDGLADPGTYQKMIDWLKANS